MLQAPAAPPKTALDVQEVFCRYVCMCDSVYVLRGREMCLRRTTL